MFTSRQYQSQAAVALELAQKSDVPVIRRGYIELHVHWIRLAASAALQGA